MTSKYPPFDRVTPGRLQVGDQVLIRANKQDAIWIDHEPRVDLGVCLILDIQSDVTRSSPYHKATRTYHLSLDVPGLGLVRQSCSAVGKWNRVVDTDN